MRLGLAQVNATVGDIAANTEMVLTWARHAAQQGAHLVAFPEMVLTGYPAEDLVLRRTFVRASQAALDALTRRLADEGLGGLAVVVGYLDENAAGRPQNAAAFLHGGRVIARYAKHTLPNYGVFDENRYFASGGTLPVVRHLGVDIAVNICEDLWADGGTVTAVARATTGLFLTINASPYERGKEQTRLDLVRRRAAEAGATLAYVNLVGGQDELVFDGGSLVVDPHGQVLTRAPAFDEGLVMLDLDLPAASDDRTGAVDVAGGRTIVVERATTGAPPLEPYAPMQPGIAPAIDDDASVYSALVTATRDYVRKNGFSSVVLGLSGGIDSALVATIAADALGASAVHTVSMPSQHSSQHSLDDALDLANRRRIDHRVLPIADTVDAFEKSLPLTGLAAENLQARVRGMLLMSLSNEHGHLVLTTGNKSELAAGYSTLYGDSAGGFAPLKDVLKTQVWRLARWRNAVAAQRGETPPIPDNSITKPPSAELRPGQLDSDSLPDYGVLDPLLADYIEGDLGRDELVARGHDPAIVDRVVRLVDAAEHKRRQYPPGPKISSRNFGRDRRLPITSRWRGPGPVQTAPGVQRSGVQG